MNCVLYIHLLSLFFFLDTKITRSTFRYPWYPFSSFFFFFSGSLYSFLFLDRQESLIEALEEMSAFQIAFEESLGKTRDAMDQQTNLMERKKAGFVGKKRKGEEKEKLLISSNNRFQIAKDLEQQIPALEEKINKFYSLVEKSSAES